MLFDEVRIARHVITRCVTSRHQIEKDVGLYPPEEAVVLVARGMMLEVLTVLILGVACARLSESLCQLAASCQLLNNLLV